MTLSLRTPILLTAIFFMIATGGCALTQKTREVKPLRITGGEEILVARHASGIIPFWCGDKPILVYQLNRGGVYYYDLTTRQNTKVARPYSNAITCTHDGEWLIYKDSLSSRYDADTIEEGIINLWRYEFKTGKSEWFFVVDTSDTDAAIFIPNTLKMYLGRKPNPTIEMPEPKWDITWNPNVKSLYMWLKDGSLAFGSHIDFSQPRRDRKRIMDIEAFHPERKSFTITSDFTSFSLLFTDNQGRLYFEVTEGYQMGDLHTYLNRCSINTKEESISCETLFDPWHSMWALGVFSDGENIVLSKWKGECLQAQMIGKDNTHCITEKGLIGGSIRISPDENWVAFEKIKSIGERGYDSDLYLLKINKTEEEE
ncbi:hypothetical protein MNBD_DELTA01-199 [hydrothermal vent metagenome]|uniref:Uncharacterized protein n=1 Tax=hydrothermal vent metagenome TaxID=652676 RepID=A0A3B0RQJ2_9ZZZZ